jgi:hypothetical protein
MPQDDENIIMLPDEIIMRKIYFVRGKEIMLDKDLAELYETETKVLKQAVRRNRDIFPEHFMFELTEKEFKNLRSQTVTSSWGGQRYAPFAFTEHGILQLANVIRSPRARKMSVKIIEVFIKMHEMLQTHRVLFEKLQNLEKEIADHDSKILVIFEYLKQLEKHKQEESDQKNRPRVGFKSRE